MQSDTPSIIVGSMFIKQLEVQMNRKIKVLHFELDKNPGGIESFLLNMYSRIDRDKYQFDFITRYKNAAKSSELKQLGAKIYVVNGFDNPLLYYRKIKRIMALGYDIIHIHKNSAANIIPFIAAKAYDNLMVVSHSHNTAPSTGKISEIAHKINRPILWKLSDEHLACSDVAGEWLYGNKNNFTVVRNGINTEKYNFNNIIRCETRKNLGLPDDAMVYGHVGHFTEQKNHEFLLRIFGEIQEKQNNAYLLLIGGGVLEDKVRCLVKNKPYSSRVFFLGLRSDVDKLMQAMDCFIMPSIYEGLPIAAIEAQAAGLRVFLANTISKETQVTDSVEWLDLKNTPKEVALKIIKIGPNRDRNAANIAVKNAGYDAIETARFLEKMYLRLSGNRGL